MPNKYPAPGRGAWKLAGGCLPGTPGSASKAGYYRLNAASEIPIGSGWLTEDDTSHDAYCVFLAVKAIQSLTGSVADGWFGPNTAAGVIATQAAAGIDADGIAGRITLKAVLTPLVTSTAAHSGVPPYILGGLLVNESALDPAAVGVNGQDHGLAQINLAAHPEISLEAAMDPVQAIAFSAADLATVHARWDGKTKADPWDVAIANHNSPLLARKWAVNGVAPVVRGRDFQIGDYVARVRAAW